MRRELIVRLNRLKPPCRTLDPEVMAKRRAVFEALAYVAGYDRKESIAEASARALGMSGRQLRMELARSPGDIWRASVAKLEAEAEIREKNSRISSMRRAASFNQHLRTQ